MGITRVGKEVYNSFYSCYIAFLIIKIWDYLISPVKLPVDFLFAKNSKIILNCNRKTLYLT